NTIGSQVEALQARSRADGLRVPAECCFLDEGYSGSTLLRPALERLRDQVAAGALDRLYVHSPDRLARNYALQVLLLDEWRRPRSLRDRRRTRRRRAADLHLGRPGPLLDRRGLSPLASAEDPQPQGQAV